MTSRNIMFMDYNYLTHTTDVNSVVYSSEDATYLSSFLITGFRSQYWTPNGHFEITTSNQVFAYDATSFNIPVGSYTSATLATAIGANSGGTFTASYNTTTKFFSIVPVGSRTLLLSNTTNTIWDVIGMVTSPDLIISTSLICDEVRIHTSEYIEMNLGAKRAIDFGALSSNTGEYLGLSPDATIKLLGSNINDFTTPEAEYVGVIGEYTAYAANSDSAKYKHWRLSIEDKRNDKPANFKFGFGYMGTATELSRNLSNGFEVAEIDPTESTVTESSAKYFHLRPTYREFSSLTLNHVEKVDMESMRSSYKRVKTNEPFYISIDPTNCITDDDSITTVVRYTEGPKQKHIIADRFSYSFLLTEVV